MLLKSIVFISLERWDEVWRRNQFICDTLLRRHPELEIVFVEPPRDVSNSLRHGSLGPLFDNGSRKTGYENRVQCFSPLKLLPNSMGVCRRLNEIHLQRQLKSFCRGRLESPHLWINDHASVHLVGALKEQSVIYDVTDDWTAANTSPTEHQLTCEQDARLCQLADAVIVCSDRLYELKHKFHKHVYLIPNGVDAQHYARVLDAPCESTSSPRKQRRQQPVLGYVGTIHDERVDIPLLENLARSMHSGSIVLVGPNHLSREQCSSLKSTGRIEFTGPVSHQRVPELMRDFDVLIVPHLISSFTESLNPIKLWEYLAAGKPIISTPVAGFRDFPQHVRLAKSALEFLALIQPALRESEGATEARKETARQNSWLSRVEQIETVLSSMKTMRESGFARSPQHATNAVR